MQSSSSMSDLVNMNELGGRTPLSRSLQELGFLSGGSKPFVGPSSLKSRGSGSIARSSSTSTSRARRFSMEGDTTFGQMFVRDKLTSGGKSASGESPLVNLLPSSQAQQQKPQSKYDPNTGQFFRSIKVEASSIPPSLSAFALLSLFSTGKLRYDSTSNTGVVINLSGSLEAGDANVTVTCVGETHVHCDEIFNSAKQQLNNLFASHKPKKLEIKTEDVNAAETVGGFTLFGNMFGSRAVEKETKLVAESSSGISLFAPADGSKQIRAVTADTCGGMTMFTATEEEEEEDLAAEADKSEVQTEDVNAAETVGGFTMFGNLFGSRAVEKETELVAENSNGITLFAPADDSKQIKHVTADTCGGMTMFTSSEEDLSAADTDSDSASSPRERRISALDAVSALTQIIADSCSGFTMFSRTSSAPAQSYDLKADTCSGMTLFSDEKAAAPLSNVHVDTCGGMTMFSAAEAEAELEAARKSCEFAFDTFGRRESCPLVDSLMGYTDLAPALRKLQQDPDTYTEDQKYLSSLCFGF